MEKCLNAFFSGTVQGVGFRYTVVHVAERYAVTGYVKNLPDGRVELMAEGEEGELREFLESIKGSGVGSCIRDIRSSWLPAAGRSHSFSIAH